MSPQYSKIVIASDLGSDTLKLVEAARKLGDAKTQYHLVHVIQPITPYGGEWMFDTSDIQERLFIQAEQRLKVISQETKIPEGNTHLLTGRSDVCITELVHEISAELLVLGVYSKKGLSTMITSTSRELIKNLPCDTHLILLGEET